MVYHSRFWRSFRRKMSEFHPGAMEGYIQNLKIHTEGDKLKFSWYSGLSHSLIHITHFFLSRCGLGKGMKHRPTPFCSFSGYRLSVLHVPQAHCFFLHKQHKSAIKLLYYASSLLFTMEWSELMSEYSLGWNVIVSSAF
jgi:hypothetical protein